MANARRSDSNSWWGVLLIGLLIGAVFGHFATKYNWLRPIGFGSLVTSTANGSAPAFTQNLCPVCPVCEPAVTITQPLKAECTNLPTQVTCVPVAKTELSCKAPPGWLKKPVPKKPVARATKPQVPSAPAAETKPAAPDLATAIQNAPAASKRPDSKTYVNELPKVSGCIRQNSKGEVKC